MTYQVIFAENLSELKSRRGSPTLPTMATMPGYNWPTDKALLGFVWDENSTATVDDATIIGSTLGSTTVGRWLRVNSGANPVNADWNATSGLSQLLNKPVLFSGNYNDLANKPALFDGTWAALTGKPTFATVSTSGSYADLTNKPTVFSGSYADLTNKPVLFDGAYTSLTGKPTIPAAQVNSDWTAITGLAAILNKPTLFSGAYSALSGIPTFAVVATTGVYSDLSGKPSLFDGAYSSLTGRPTIPTAQINSDWASVSGLSQVLNKPTTLSGYGITDAASASALSGYATTSSLTAGLLTKVDVIVPAYSYPTRTLNTAVQLSTTREGYVVYAVDISITSLLAATEGSVFLEFADNAAMTTNLVNVVSGGSAVSGVLNVANKGTVTLSGIIPAGKYVRIRTAIAAGTPTFASRQGQEVLR